MITGTESRRASSRCMTSKPSIPGQPPVEQNEARGRLGDRGEGLLPGARLDDGDRLLLEVGAQELPQRGQSGLAQEASRGATVRGLSPAVAPRDASTDSRQLARIERGDQSRCRFAGRPVSEGRVRGLSPAVAPRDASRMRTVRRVRVAVIADTHLPRGARRLPDRCRGARGRRCDPPCRRSHLARFPRGAARSSARGADGRARRAADRARSHRGPAQGT